MYHIQDFSVKSALETDFLFGGMQNSGRSTTIFEALGAKLVFLETRKQRP